MEKIQEFCNQVEEVSYNVLTLLNVMDCFDEVLFLSQCHHEKEEIAQMYDLFRVMNSYAKEVKGKVCEILVSCDELC